MWEECSTLNSMSFEDALAVIEDAKCHGFEFKMENAKLYFREIDSSQEK